jgi:hypothetical protein
MGLGSTQGRALIAWHQRLDSMQTTLQLLPQLYDLQNCNVQA